MKITRRRFLRAAGVSLALPWLDAFAAANDTPGAGARRRRMVCMCTPLGLHPPSFFPEKAGAEYALSPYLELIKEFRGDFTVMSGLSHPEVAERVDHQDRQLRRVVDSTADEHQHVPEPPWVVRKGQLGEALERRGEREVVHREAAEAIET